jgi:ureidoglycolate amidohydrolase
MKVTSMLDLKIDSQALQTELQQLASMSDCAEPVPAVTRVVFTPTDLRARNYLASLYEEAGLSFRVDAIGNTFARWVGSDFDLPAIGTGSHIDAIPHAGMYDGTVGVLGGLEAIRALQRSGFQPKRSIELLMFTSEEPTRFGIGCSGSRAMSGALTIDQLCALTDDAGDNYDVVRRRAGFVGSLEQVRLPSDYYHAWVELHIEQGPELERLGTDIGIVTAIAAPASLVLTIHGQGGHAGAVLMPIRRDALCAAAEMISMIECQARSSHSQDLVATVGSLDVHPGAVNSIPSRVRFTLDIRDIDADNRDQVIATIRREASSIAARRNVELQIECKNSDPPAIASQPIISAIERACQATKASHQKMISRAYHDSLFMARIAPISMIFIPCRGGVSHRPDEYSTPEQIGIGVEVLARTLAELSYSSS